MELDPKTCYRVIAGRDRRFEGRFVVAVVTTKIYCRPGCPAPVPRRRNMRFYPCAAAAEEAGFRACLRCRPDAAAGTPAWLGTSATVSRALRLLAVEDGESPGVEALAARLGVGSRHLRRLFIEHLGASPLAVVQTRRAHFARKLLDETNLPMTEVALLAGYTSIRRFNDSIRRTFHQPPTRLRRISCSKTILVPGRSGAASANRPEAPALSGRVTKTRRANQPTGGDSSFPPARLVLKLPYRPPLDWSFLIAYFSGRATPGVEAADRETGVYSRTIEWNGTPGWLSVRAAPDGRNLELDLSLPVTKDLLSIVERVSRIFDLGADPLQIGGFLAQAGLGPIIRKLPGLRIPGAWDPFELTIRAMLGQQISVQAATTLAGRLVREFGRPAGTMPGFAARGGPALPDVRLTHFYPSPAVVAEAELERIGIPGARARAIRGLAEAVRDGRLRFENLRSLDEITAALCALPGIGEWTAHYVALRAFGEPDAFPASDLGLRKAASGDGDPISTKDLAARAMAWSPWRGYAAMALWWSLMKPANDASKRLAEKKRRR